MGYYDLMKKDLDNIYNALMDEESRDLFDIRMEYMITNNKDIFLNSIFALKEKYPKKWKHLGMERFAKNEKFRGGWGGIIIYGCGHDGKLLKDILEMCGYSVSYWCDSNEQLVGKKVKGIKVISARELVEKYKDYLVVIGSMRYKAYIWERLRAFDFPLDQVTVFTDNADDWGIYGKQYFDMFLPDNEEVFVDAGAYNGDTTFDFLTWSKGKKCKVYLLEPIESMCEFIKERLNKHNILNVELLNCAAWCREEELCFEDRGDGSAVVEQGEVKVKGNSIDNIVGKDKVTFIKLDVEGSELEVLKGAYKTIQKYHPKLAVCIYHKSFDMLQIGGYILSLYPNYKFYIRHYTLTMCETVLYAIP